MKNLIILILAVTFILSFLSTYLTLIVTRKRKILDIPNDRSSHTEPTPIGGGIGIVISWYSLITFSYFTNLIDQKLFFALLPGLILVFVNIFDDFRGLSTIIRFIAQFVATIAGVFFLSGLQIIDLGFKEYEFYWIINIPLIIVMIWFINLFNFLDGIDGYLGSEGIFIFLAIFIFTGNIFSLAFMFCILGFLVLNWPKAKIFCGDTGSTLIGYNLMIFSIYLQNTDKLSFFIPIVLSGLFWVDATITLFRRWRNNEKILIAHRKHAYQRLNQSGYTHKQILYFTFIVNFFLFAIAYLAVRNPKFIVPALFIHIIPPLIFIKIADRKRSFQ